MATEYRNSQRRHPADGVSTSPDFIASDFIHEYELGPFLKEAKQGGSFVHFHVCRLFANA